MNFKTKTEIIWYVILYPIAGIMLLILLFDIYTGKAYIKNGSTLPHQAYMLVLPVLIHVTYKILKAGDIDMKEGQKFRNVLIKCNV